MSPEDVKAWDTVLDQVGIGGVLILAAVVALVAFAVSFGRTLGKLMAEDAVRALPTVWDRLADLIVKAAAALPGRRGARREAVDDALAALHDRATLDGLTRWLLLREAVSLAWGQPEVAAYRTRLIRLHRVRRVLDVAVVTVLLIGLTPVFLLTAATVVLTLGHPVIYRQQRVGPDGRVFNIYRLRTLPQLCWCPRCTRSREEHARADGVTMTDLCLTPVGRLIRLASIDYLPELINVLRGEMTLIGPRPELTVTHGRPPDDQKPTLNDQNGHQKAGVARAWPEVLEQLRQMIQRP